MKLHATKIVHDSIDGGHKIFYAFDEDRLKYNKNQFLDEMDISYEDVEFERTKINSDKVLDFVERHF